ncbi:hypothetical protein MRX96_007556 [Rhipicephalus microplus]
MREAARIMPPTHEQAQQGVGTLIAERVYLTARDNTCHVASERERELVVTQRRSSQASFDVEKAPGVKRDVVLTYNVIVRKKAIGPVSVSIIADDLRDTLRRRWRVFYARQKR